MNYRSLLKRMPLTFTALVENLLPLEATVGKNITDSAKQTRVSVTTCVISTGCHFCCFVCNKPKVNFTHSPN